MGQARDVEIDRHKQIDDWLPITSARNAKWWYSAFHNVTTMLGDVEVVVEGGVNIVYMVTGSKSLKKFHDVICPSCKDIRTTYWIMIFASMHFVLSHLPNFNSIFGISLAAAVMSLRRLEEYQHVQMFNRGRGFATDDQYNVYDKGLFTAQPTMSTLCWPKKDADNAMYGDVDEQMDRILMLLISLRCLQLEL